MRPWLALLVAAAAAVAVLTGCAAEKPTVSACPETQAVALWPDEYGKARGAETIWLIDNGAPHQANEQRKVAWRVKGMVDRLDVAGQRLDGPGEFTDTVTGRVWPNGVDRAPAYWDSVSLLTIPSSGCWQLTLTAGTHTERITLDVK